MCGQCCTMISENSNLVLLSAPEVRKIMEGTRLSWNEIAEPYPETLETKDGAEYTFAWSLRRNDKKCFFLEQDNRCKIYNFRPLICRTYPFMLENGELLVFDCPGTGSDIEDSDAERTAMELIERAEFEEADLNKTLIIFDNAKLSGDKLYVIDSEGVKIVG